MRLQEISWDSSLRNWSGLCRLARRPFALLAQNFYDERPNWPLWLPVLAGFGVLAYFFSDFDIEPLFLGLGLAALGLAMATAWRLERPFAPIVAVAAVLAGYGAVNLRANLVEAPVLKRSLPVVMLSGEVVDVEPLANDGVRVVLEALDFENRTIENPPRRVRLRLPPKSTPVAPGQRIRLYASLMPPAGPAYPGGYDFARAAWFQQLGAIGFGMGKVEIVDKAAKDRFESLLDAPKRWIADIRLVMTKRVLDQLEGDRGAVSAALITGGERAISKELLEAYRDSGLAHLLSVSGLHISLVAGLVFVGLRAVLALVPALALRFPIKKWTALGAMLAALFYLFVSGAFVPTQRSFLMTGIVLLGVVLDRQAISMRLVAWAAMAILLTQPESLLGASFQMSFAAVLALVAVYESVQRPVLAWRRQGGWWRGFVLYVAMLTLSSLVAGLATAPFSIENFNRFNPYGVASNMIAVPLSGVIVMPAALVAVLLMPFGLDWLALAVMGFGVDLINAVAIEVASWPGAGIAVPSFSNAGFGSVILGGLWFLLMRRRWRWFGLLALLFGLTTSFTAKLPTLLIDGGPGLVALRLADGTALISPGKKEPITREAWRRHLALSEDFQPFADGAAAGGVRCDALSCLVEVNGLRLALPIYPEALTEDCANADILVAAFAVSNSICPKPVVFDRRYRLRSGPLAVWVTDGGIERVESVNDRQSRRPWARGGNGPQDKTSGPEAGDGNERGDASREGAGQEGPATPANQ